MSLQNKPEEVNNNVLVEMRKLNESFSKLQAEVSVTKQVNTLLSGKLVNIQWWCWLNVHYCKWTCRDIVGISSEVETDALEETVVAIVKKLGYNIPTELTEACHRINKKNPTVIVKFLQRMFVSRFWISRETCKK